LVIGLKPAKTRSQAPKIRFRRLEGPFVLDGPLGPMLPRFNLGSHLCDLSFEPRPDLVHQHSSSQLETRHARFRFSDTMKHQA
jgi:hypothetical protein